MKEGGVRVSRTGPAPRGRGTEAGIIPTSGQLFGTEEKHLRLLESAAADLWQSKWNKNHAILAAALQTLDRSPGTRGGCELELGTGEHPRAGCCGLEGDGLRGREGEDHCGKCLWKKAGQPWRQGDSAESHAVGGVIAVGSLPMPAPAADQQRKALEGWPSKCLTSRAIEKDPTQREPFKCLMHGATEKDKPKRPFAHSSPDAREDSNGATASRAEVASTPTHLEPRGSPLPKQLYHLHAQS